MTEKNKKEERQVEKKEDRREWAVVFKNNRDWSDARNSGLSFISSLTFNNETSSHCFSGFFGQLTGNFEEKNDNIVWIVQCETDMYDDSSIVKTEEIEDEKPCGLNEVWMVCSSCEEECGKPSQPCPRVCQPARCQCPAHKGFRRNSKGECVFCHETVPKH
uniref:TIL domain-containing protein n=1 Tax=Caenorhabditis tropicalis TaxID=1561998 RepID=A0A1I7T042_9PELO